MTLILFTTIAPHQLTDELSRAGFRVYETIAISEVLHLIETENIDAVVIASDVPRDLSEIQERRITLRLKANATGADVIWELTQLFPDTATIQ